MLKVLYLPIGNQPGTCDGFKNLGVDLRVYDFLTASQHNSKPNVNNKFLNHVKEFKPDLIHMQLQMTDVISNQTLVQARRIVPNAVITNWTGDIRKEPSKSFIETSKYVNYSLLSHVGQLQAYKNAGCNNARYWQIGYDPKNFKPTKFNNFKYDITFAGSNYNIFPDSKLRLNIVRNLKKRYGSRFGLFGNGYPKNLKATFMPIEKINETYNDSLCVLSVSNFNDISHYFSDRLLMCLASGRPTIMYRFPKYQSYFGHLNDILVANSIDEIISMVEFCKRDLNEANRIGKNGHLKINAEHSFTSRIIELLTFTGLIGKV